jgi:homoserine kinase
MQEVVVRVPASTSNLGPGFDCLGVALRLYNEVRVKRGTRQRLHPMISEAADLFFETSEVRAFRFSCAVSGDVPVSRGLGSSVTVRLGVLHALNELTGRSLNRQQLFELCTELEGHPDNAAPAEFGGFNISRPTVDGVKRQRFTVSSSLKFVLLVPAFEVSTAEARALLPEKLSRRDAVSSCGNAAAIAAAFASGDYEHLRGSFADGLHQPYRKHLLPFFDAAVAAAEHVGALGGFLSGSGSTIAAVTLQNAPEIGAAMLETAPQGARVFVTTADNTGTKIIR